MKAIIRYTMAFVFLFGNTVYAQNAPVASDLDSRFAEISQSGFMSILTVTENPNVKSGEMQTEYWEIDFIRTSEGLHYVFETPNGIYFGRPKQELYFVGNPQFGYKAVSEFNSPIMRDLPGLWFNRAYAADLLSSGDFEKNTNGTQQIWRKMTQPGSDYSGSELEFEYNGIVPVSFLRNMSSARHRYYHSQRLNQYHLNQWTKEKFDEFFLQKLAEVNKPKTSAKSREKSVTFSTPLVSLDGEEFRFSEKKLNIWVFIPEKAPNTELLRTQLKQWETRYGEQLQISIISSVPNRWPVAEWNFSSGIKMYRAGSGFLERYGWNKDEIQIAWIEANGTIVSQFIGYHADQAEKMDKILIERMK